ncbi:hypothetical protein FIBSPDRAFT_930145 [Athelia psychrophila]|uniref:DUF6533 domain-containing protein n=1 Tax=Athelia psychrophila TaxID=1759441 RepID=A0A166MEC9_9AGAM|nr:hypothetical protein FIBSPDRAFT_930145 [Fibularhizoctonia sp. CBS 109695]
MWTALAAIFLWRWLSHTSETTLCNGSTVRRRTDAHMEIDSSIAARDVRLHTYVQLISVLVLCYDAVLTMPDEISGIWSRKKTLISWLYLINRYLAILGNVGFLALVFKTLSPGAANSPRTQECGLVGLLGQMLLFANQFLICLILLIRIYAIYARDVRILGLFLGLGVISAAVTAFSLVNQKSKPLVGYPGCILQHTTANGIRLAAPWECMFVWDALVMVLTIRKTLKSRLPSHARRTSGTNIASLVFRDGAMYFAAMTFVNILNILAFYLTPPLLKGSLSTVTSVMGVTLVSRVVLNLREASAPIAPPQQSSWSDPGVVSHTNSRGNFQLQSIDARGPVDRSPVISYGWQATADDPLPIIHITHTPRLSYKSLAV